MTLTIVLNVGKAYWFIKSNCIPYLCKISLSIFVKITFKEILITDIFVILIAFTRRFFISLFSHRSKIDQAIAMKLLIVLCCCIIGVYAKILTCEVKFLKSDIYCEISNEDLTLVSNVTFDTGNLPPDEFSMLGIRAPMTDLPIGIFSTFPELKSLVLVENKLKEWKAEYLKYGWELQSLIVTQNLIERLNSEIFYKAPYLASIEFSHNRIAYISPGAFAGLENLVELNLNENQLGPELKAETFLSMPKTLEFLNLSRNGIAKFEREVFKTFKHLEEILIYGNEFDEFDENILPVSITFIGVGK